MKDYSKTFTPLVKQNQNSSLPVRCFISYKHPDSLISDYYFGRIQITFKDSFFEVLDEKNSKKLKELFSSVTYEEVEKKKEEDFKENFLNKPFIVRDKEKNSNSLFYYFSKDKAPTFYSIENNIPKPEDRSDVIFTCVDSFINTKGNKERFFYSTSLPIKYKSKDLYDFASSKSDKTSNFTLVPSIIKIVDIFLPVFTEINNNVIRYNKAEKKEFLGYNGLLNQHQAIECLDFQMKPVLKKHYLTDGQCDTSIFEPYADQYYEYFTESREKIVKLHEESISLYENHFGINEKYSTIKDAEVNKADDDDEIPF